ncbi:glycine oxidase ThiO [Paenibacillus sp. GCM10027626]|uniref:glycine oxidase ThiO n=1 Tax=Paenibacillus sp. GCM10027626 TaxID=3273411 RepID=UPI003643EE80
MAGRIIVLGGGVIGLSCAFEAVQRGFQVTVIEQASFGGQASGAAAGMLAPYTENPEQPDPFFQLCQESLRQYPEWVKRIESVSGINPELLATGSLTVALHEADLLPLKTRMAWQSAYGASDVELIEQGKRLRAMEPLLTDKAVAALYNPAERHVNAPRMVAALEEACRKLGVELVDHAGEVAIDASGPVVRTSKKGEWHGDRLVVCTGAWACQLADELGLPIPIHPIRGQICAYEVPFGYTHHMIFSSQAYWVGKRNGTLVCGASEDVAGYSTAVTDKGIGRLVRWGERLFPYLAGRPTIRRWAGLRPATRDGWPLIGELPAHSHIIIAAGHYRNGILLSPVTARLVGDLLSGHAHAARVPLAPFAPDRFTAGATGDGK